jgi:ribosomal protein S18 acetylase RimI-like enzyme
MTHLEFKAAVPEDQGRLFALHVTLFREQIEPIWGWDDSWQLENFLKEWNEVRTVTIHDEGRLAGCIQTREAPDHFYLLNLAIDLPFQSRGIGSEAMRQLQQEAAARAMAVRLSVFKSNDRVLGFYRRLGFRITEETETGFRLQWLSDE